MVTEPLCSAASPSVNARASGDCRPINGLLRKVLAFDKSPYVLSNLSVFVDHHPMVTIGIQPDTQIRQPLVEAAEIAYQQRSVLHSPDHERWHFDDHRLRSLGDLHRRPGM